MPETIPEVVPAECMDAMCQAWDYLDNRLTPPAKGFLRAHIDACEHCQAYLRFQRSVIQALRAARKRGPAPLRTRARLFATLVRAGYDPK